jgi:uncharacterized glyoxalase superfamily protein PhnB
MSEAERTRAEAEIRRRYLKVRDTPLQDRFWGDRYGSVKDPFGVAWWARADLASIAW